MKESEESEPVTPIHTETKKNIVTVPKQKP